MKRIQFNDDWYVETKRSGHTEVKGPFSVPMDMMIFETRDAELATSNTGYYPGGTYHYKKTFTAPEDWRTQTVLLEFEAVYHRSKVYVNGELAGGRPNGYLPVHVPLDKHLKYGSGQNNVIEVHVDTSGKPNSRWYSGSGIYRPVALHIGSRNLYIPPYNCRIHTSAINENGSASLSVLVNAGSDLPFEKQPDVVITIRDAEGEEVDHKIWSTTYEGTNSVRVQLHIEQPRLWSPEDPYLYSAEVEVTNESGSDTTHETIGICTRSLDSADGFKLNGKSYKLRGACLHHDSGIIGANTLEMVEDRKIRIVKENGYNAVRSSHNAASQAMLRACDKYGIFMMDELADMWRCEKGGALAYHLDFDDWWKRDLTMLVQRNYNHPSIAFTSIGNEIRETATYWGIEQTKKMVAHVKSIDQTRFVTNAINGFLNVLTAKTDAAERPKWPTDADKGDLKVKGLVAVMNTFMGILGPVMDYIAGLGITDRKTFEAMAPLDLVGYNYMISRYDQDVIKYPGRVIVGSESGTALMYQIWPLVEKYPQLIGDFGWTGWDYLGESGLCSVQYKRRTFTNPYPALLAGASVIDLLGFPQSQSWWNQIIWGTRTSPIISVRPLDCSHTAHKYSTWRATDAIESWSFEGHEGEETTVIVYSAAPRVRLSLNGRTLKTGAAGPDHQWKSEFKIPYQPGTLSAVALDENDHEMGSCSLTSSDASQMFLSISVEETNLRANGQDVAVITVEITDKAGVIRVLQDREITIEVDSSAGTATLAGFGTARAETYTPYTSKTQKSYYGRAMAMVRSGLTPGRATCTFSAPGVQSASCILEIAAEKL